MTKFKLPPFTVQEAINSAEIPWGVKHINADKVWDTTKGKGVVVAVLDTGADKNHPDLKDVIIDGKNFTPDYNGDAKNFSDNQGHGTHCAGTIAGVIDNSGVIGVAPEVKLIIGKVLQGNGSGDYYDIIAGIKWATNWVGPNGETVRVISMSLGGPVDVPALYSAIKAAVDKGISVVCAAGNNGDGNHNTNEYNFPGAYQDVIEVGATDVTDNVASFSNTNDKIDVVAPGVDIVSSMPNGRWAKMSGTSMATPHVAGAIALLISAFETEDKRLSEEEVYELLLKYVRPLPYAKNAVGYGIVDFEDFGIEEPIIEQPTEEEMVAEYSIISKGTDFFINIGPFKTQEEAEAELLKATEKILTN